MAWDEHYFIDNLFNIVALIICFITPYIFHYIVIILLRIMLNYFLNLIYGLHLNLLIYWLIPIKKIHYIVLWLTKSILLLWLCCVYMNLKIRKWVSSNLGIRLLNHWTLWYTLSTSWQTWCTKLLNLLIKPLWFWWSSNRANFCFYKLH